MLEYIIKRILLFIPTLFLITAVSFLISRLAPGDPAAIKAGQGSEGAMSSRSNINARTVELIRKQWNLDKPMWQQYLIWTGNLFKLDFGKNILCNFFALYPAFILCGLVVKSAKYPAVRHFYAHLLP
ncbi:MAG: hypothetical protein V4642_01220 [Bacteroidota bacterium]